MNLFSMVLGERGYREIFKFWLTWAQKQLTRLFEVSMALQTTLMSKAMG
jgi:hypothetical protein